MQGVLQGGRRAARQEPPGAQPRSAARHAPVAARRWQPRRWPVAVRARGRGRARALRRDAAARSAQARGDRPQDAAVPAHLSEEACAQAVLVVYLLHPWIKAEIARIGARQRQAAQMGAKKAEKICDDEQLHGRLMVYDSMLFACATALCCMTDGRASGRSSGSTRGDEHVAEVLRGRRQSRLELFADNAAAREAMHDLAKVVRRKEEEEMVARSTPGDKAVSDAMIASIRKHEERCDAREQALMQKQQETIETQNAFMQQMMKVMTTSGAPTALPLASSASAPSAPSAPSVPVATSTTAAVFATRTEPLAPMRHKRKRVAQTDVKTFASWKGDLRAALAYARDELAPQERAHGSDWRILKIDGVKNESRSTQWRYYRALAIEVGVAAERTQRSTEAAIDDVQARFRTEHRMKCKPFLDEVFQKIDDMGYDRAEKMAKSMLNY